MQSPFSQAFTSDRAGISIADFLADETGLSKKKIKQVMTVGGVWRKPRDQDPERIHRHSEVLNLFDEVHIYYDEAIIRTPAAKLSLVADHHQFSVWFKPASMLIEPHLYCDHLSFERAVSRDLPHDRDIHLLIPDEIHTFGLCLFAHTRALGSTLLEVYQAGKIQAEWQGTCDSQYEALIRQHFKDARLTVDKQTVDFTYSCPLNEAKPIVEVLMQSMSSTEINHPFLACTAIELPSTVSDVSVFRINEEN